jgi:hypothetical protein
MKGHLRVALLDLEPPALASKPASDRLTENTTVAKILHCGKNKITESVPVHGFGLGSNKAKAKSVAIGYGSWIRKISRRQASHRATISERGMSYNDTSSSRSREDHRITDRDTPGQSVSFSGEKQLRHCNFLPVIHIHDCEPIADSALLSQLECLHESS